MTDSEGTIEFEAEGEDAGQELTAAPIETPPAPRKSDLGWLGRNGGWVLLGLGLMFIGISVLLSDKQAVSSIFGFSGIAATVFGVLLPRLEGPFQFSPTKFAATLVSARSVGTRDDLTLEERADLILRILEVEGERRPYHHDKRLQRMQEKLESGSGVGPLSALRRPSLPRPIPVELSDNPDRIRENGVAFEQHVAQLFREDGWTVEELDLANDTAANFVARKDGEDCFVETKLRRRLSGADGRRIVETARASYKGRDPNKTRHVLAVNLGALSKKASQELLGYMVEVMEIPVDLPA